MPPKFLLDSDICIFAMKRRTPALLRRLDQRATTSAISVVAYGELAFGEVMSVRRDEAAAHLAALLETLQVLPLPLEAARRYAEIRAELQRVGQPIGSNDLWIAAHALAEDLTLVTNNEREFQRVPGLRVENWAR
ncbi:MAG TPA: type II toxin-antitoxin system VapC family toxin [Gammaproteobacteria bacterium]